MVNLGQSAKRRIGPAATAEPETHQLAGAN
jgi:hypothetical protein